MDTSAAFCIHILFFGGVDHDRIKGISVDEWKKKICEEAERLRPQLIELSHSIHDEPEIGFQEFKSSAKICDFLEKQGFETERDYCDLPTSFKAVKKGTGKGPVVAFLAEYDALRGVGHGSRPQCDRPPVLPVHLLLWQKYLWKWELQEK